MTQLSTAEHEALMEDMRGLDEQMPCVGIFWYDPADKALFGVRKSELTPKMVEDAADDGVPYINYPHLHRQGLEQREESQACLDFPESRQSSSEAQIWAKEFFRARAKHEDTKFIGDYTQIPRGRVTWAVDKFLVFVGQWAKPIEAELTELIEKEFSLPYFEFVYDYHWDLGHGWSGDMK